MRVSGLGIRARSTIAKDSSVRSSALEFQDLTPTTCALTVAGHGCPYRFSAICERTRSSCSLSSGVNPGPKSSASNT